MSQLNSFVFVYVTDDEKQTIVINL